MNKIIDRKMSIWDTFDESYKLFFENIGSVFAIMVLFGLPSAIFEFYSKVALNRTEIASSLGIVIELIFLVIGEMAIINLIYSNIKGEKISWTEAIVMSLPKSPKAIGATMIATILTILGLVVFVIPGIMVMVALSLFLQFMVIEGTGIRESIRKSDDLTGGSKFDIFFKLIIVALPAILMGICDSFMLDSIKSSFPAIIIVISLVSSVLQGVSTIAATLIYINLKSVKHHEVII